MTEQLSLDMHPLVTPTTHAGATIAERFDAFHQANAWVLDALEQMTADLIRRGRHRVGMKMLVEVIRWNYARHTSTQNSGDFKVNNDFTSRYARLILDRHPEWHGVFETRELRAA